MSRALLLACLVGAALGLGADPLVHDDLFWHVRAGELIASGTIPTTDPFSHTRAGARWVTHEWGYEWLVYVTAAATGLHGLIGLKQLVIALIAVAVFGLARRAAGPGRDGWLAALTIVGLLAGELASMLQRAALFGTLFLAVMFALALRLSRQGRARDAAALLLLFLVWANMHTGVIFGLVALSAFYPGEVLAARRTGARGPACLLRGRPGKVLALVAAATAVTLVNPNGVALWTYPLELNRILFDGEISYTMGHYAFPGPARFPAFYLLVVIVLASLMPLAGLRQRLASGSFPTLAFLLASLFFLVMTLRSSRFVLDFMVCAVPLAAGGFPARGAPGVRMRQASAVVAVILATGVVLWRPPLWPADPVGPRYPKRAADFLIAEGIRGTMFNPDNVGGYLGYRLEQPIYWDGRNLLFHPTALELVRADALTPLIDRHGLDLLLLDAAYHGRYRAELAGLADRFALVYWDERLAVYLKRIPRFGPIIARHEFALVRPFAAPADLAVAVQDPDMRARLRGEYDRVLGNSDRVPEALYARAVIANADGDTALAERLLARSLELRPGTDLVARGRSR